MQSIIAMQNDKARLAETLTAATINASTA